MLEIVVIVSLFASILHLVNVAIWNLGRESADMTITTRSSLNLLIRRQDPLVRVKYILVIVAVSFGKLVPR